jgi:predicted ATPase
LKLGLLNLFIGTNASGKSNLFDALRVLRGLAGGFSVSELFEGGARTLAGGTLPGIRGGLGHAAHKGAENDHAATSPEASLQVEFTTRLGQAGYAVSFNTAGATTREKLSKDGREVFFFDGQEACFRLSAGGLSPCYPNAFVGSQVILAFRTGLAGEHKEFVEAWMRGLLSMQFFELDPDVLRRYGTAADIPGMGERGENFASLARHICDKHPLHNAYLGWLQELRPRELDDVTTLQGAVGEPLFALREGARVFPAPVLSEGTLRFAALAAAFFQPDMPEVMTIEEIENGIHPGRLRLLLQLLRQRAGQAPTQVMATTHSPLLLDWLTEEEWDTTFFCQRDPLSGASSITPMSSLPGFRDAAKPGQVGQLLAEGWMDFAL